MTKDDLKRLLERNPSLANANPNICEVLTAKQKPGTADALDPVVQGKGKSQRCVTVRFVVCRARLLDVDAVAGCCKDLLDGLQDAGLITGDRPDQISFTANQQKVDKKNEGTIIEIEL